MMREDTFRCVIQSHAEFVGAFNHIGIAQGTGGSDNRLDSGGGGDFNAVSEGE